MNERKNTTSEKNDFQWKKIFNSNISFNKNFRRGVFALNFIGLTHIYLI